MSGAILGVETSCDDSCAAVLSADGVILSNVISSQAIHDKYGGVVPEIAARHHLELLTPAIASALAQAGLGLEQIERVAVTQGPGLIGALLVGVGQAKAIAAARAIPLVAVDHLQGHVAANFIAPDPFEPPFICLIASGGHTLLARVEDHSSYTLLGETLDDAAGEAFDKGARMLGLPFPGGPALEALAAGGVRLVSGGTDNHLMLVDVTPLGIGGKLAEQALDRCGITCNKNMIPFDQRKPMDPSGIRLGTPALTTRGLGTAEMKQVAAWILRVLKAPEDETLITATRRDVAELAEQFPVPAAKLEAVER